MLQSYDLKEIGSNEKKNANYSIFNANHHNQFNAFYKNKKLV